MLGVQNLRDRSGSRTFVRIVGGGVVEEVLDQASTVLAHAPLLKSYQAQVDSSDQTSVNRA